MKEIIMNMINDGSSLILGVNNTEIMEKVFNENLFHYPTEKTIKKVFVRHV